MIDFSLLDSFPEPERPLCNRCGAYWDCGCVQLVIPPFTINRHLIPDYWAEYPRYTAGYPTMPPKLDVNTRLKY